MLSMPPAATMALSPVRICCAASATARRPEPQTWLMPNAVLASGRPAARAAWRAGFWPSPAVSTWPRITSSTSAGFHAGALEGGLQRDGAKLVRGQRAQSAAEATNGGAGGGDDDDVVHVWLSLLRCGSLAPPDGSGH